MTTNMPRMSRLLALSAPISSVTIPLFNGLARRSLLRAGLEQRDVRLHGAALNYYRAGRPGAAPPVLLIHGLADSAMTWALMLGPLSRHYEVYAVDLPGYGFSGLPPGTLFASLDQMTATLTSFVREVVGRPALAVGNSMGGWLGVRLAWADPQSLRGLVLVNAGGAPLQGRLSWEPFVTTISAEDLRTVRLVFRQMFGRAPAALAFLWQHGLREQFQRRIVREFVSTVQEDEFLRADDLRRLPVPGALVWGTTDRFLPDGSFEFFRDNMPDAPVLELRRCGHLPQRERPGALLRFIRRFAEQL